MATTRIHRYITREIAVPTLLGLVIFTFVLLMGRILKLVELVINKGVPFLETAKLFCYLLPAFLVITLPLAFLLGVLLGFGRLSTDSEIVALKSSGIGVYRMVKPVIGLGLLVSLATALLTLLIEPASNTSFRNQVFQIASSRASIGIQARVFNDEFDGLLLYANELEERKGVMEGVFISDERVGKIPSVIMAERGRVLSDPENRILTLRLENGTIHRKPSSGDQDAYQVIGFTTYDINLNMGQDLTTIKNRNRKENELSLTELRQMRSEAENDNDRRSFTVELQRRFILPLAPLIFALIGVPLGIQSHRSGRGGGFAIALFIFLAYYLLFSFAETLAEEAGVAPLPIMWTPTLLFLATGFYLLHLAAAEKRLVLLDRIVGIPLWLRRQFRGKE